jgi:hypothetical protein
MKKILCIFALLLMAQAPAISSQQRKMNPRLTTLMERGERWCAKQDPGQYEGGLRCSLLDVHVDIDDGYLNGYKMTGSLERDPKRTIKKFKNGQRLGVYGWGKSKRYVLVSDSFDGDEIYNTYEVDPRYLR